MPLRLDVTNDSFFPTGFIEPCLLSKVTRPLSGPLRVREIKHDGYRLMVRRDPAAINVGFDLRRQAMKPMPAKPRIIIAHVEGSGTAPPITTVKFWFVPVPHVHS